MSVDWSDRFTVIEPDEDNGSIASLWCPWCSSRGPSIDAGESLGALVAQANNHWYECDASPAVKP